jgi:glycogen debranching enzyme
MRAKHAPVQAVLDAPGGQADIRCDPLEDLMSLIPASLYLALSLAVATPTIDSVSDLAVPKFAILPSPLTIRGDVRPLQYLGSVGRKAAWLGLETGEAELWVHPLELADDFRLDFKIPEYVQPIRGANVARTVEVRPEITTITYTHATFTVRQHILAPLDAPGILVLLEVETIRPLEVIVSFKPVFQYAWPGAFGGQYTFWNAEEKAFVLSESLRQRNALIGSPWATVASSHPAHMLADAPNTFTIPVDTARAAREFVPIAIAAGIASRDSVVAIYHALLANAESFYRERRDHVNALLSETTSIDTPDDELDLAFAWSKVNLDEQLVCNPDLGCGLVAGWGRSGVSTRPGFGWFFGGDAAINTFAMDATAHWDPVAQGLRFLARFQREDGKITHEISQSAGRIPWFEDFPYGYYHADTTPYWIVAVWRYWRASGDDTLLRDVWPAVQRAYAWCLTTETDGDGIIENTSGGAGAIEVGSIGARIHQDVYLAAVWIGALQAMSELAATMGDRGLSRDADALHRTALATLNRDYWREGEGHHAFGILQSGETNDNLTVWPATAAAFQLLDRERAVLTLRKLATDSISADWGARMLSTGSPLYDPVHYNMGAVWPFVTGFVSWGQYNYGRPWSGYPLIDAVKQMTFDWARGRHPELLSGRFYRPPDEAVPHQFFATSMLISPIMMGVFGWEPDAPRSSARLAPQLPPHWGHARVQNLKVGQTSIDAALLQGPERFVAELSSRGPAVTLELAIPVPAGAREIQSSAEGAVQTTDAGRVYLTTLRLSGTPVRVELRWSGGLALEPPLMELRPGQSSEGLRALDFREAGAEWLLLVEGTAGHDYEVRLHGAAIANVRGATLLNRTGSVSTIRVTFPAGSGRVTREVRLGS